MWRLTPPLPPLLTILLVRALLSAHKASSSAGLSYDYSLSTDLHLGPMARGKCRPHRSFSNAHAETRPQNLNYTATDRPTVQWLQWHTIRPPNCTIATVASDRPTVQWLQWHKTQAAQLYNDYSGIKTITPITDACTKLTAPWTQVHTHPLHGITLTWLHDL